MMPRKVGETIQDRISFTFTPINLRDVQKSMESKEFPTVANLLNTAIRFYFENRERSSSKDQVKEWLLSEEGEEYITGLIRKVKEEM